MLGKLLDRPVTVTMLMLVIVVLGSTCFNRLPVSLIPDIDIPNMTVRISSQDLSARELDRSVVSPLRQRLMQIKSLKDIKAVARDGDATIRMTFEPGTNMDYAFIEANEHIDRAMSSLPDIARPIVFKSDGGDIPAFYINVTSDEDGQSYRVGEYVRQIFAKRLEQLQSVAMVDISGYNEYEISITPDENKLRQSGMTVGQLGDCVKSAAVRLGSLEIRDGEYRYSVKFKAFTSNIKDIEDIWLNLGSRTLQLRDVAKVEMAPSERSGLVRSDGSEAVCLAVIKQSEARMSDLRRDVDKVIRNISRENPELRISVTRDQTALLEYSIDSLVQNIILAVVLACLVVFLFMKDFRSSALVAITIPLALVFSILVFFIMGMTINIISLSGLVLGVGMMVDNTIILTDNISSHRERGGDLRTSVIEGTREVLGPMFSSVLTTCAVFIPLIFVSGIAGTMFYDQAMSVTVVLLSSYAVTILVIPVYYYWWYRKPVRPSSRRKPARRGNKTGIKLYDSIMSWFLNRPWTVWAAISLCSVLAVICLAFMPKETLPPISYSDAILKIDWNEHLSLEQNSLRVSEIEGWMDGRTVQHTSYVGQHQYILDHSGVQSTRESSIYVKCRDAESLRALSDAIESRVRETWPHAVAGWAPSGNIFNMVFSDDTPMLVARLRPTGNGTLEVDKLRTLTNRLDKALGLRSSEMKCKTDLLYIADSERMAVYGVTISELTGTLRSAIAADRLFNISRGESSIPVVIGDGGRESGDVFRGLSVEHHGIRIPVSALLRQTYEEELAEIVSGTEGVYYPYELSLPMREVRSAMKVIRGAVRDDGHFEVSFSGSWFDTAGMVKDLLIVLCLAVALLFLILASQFESLVQPLIILSEIIIDTALSLLVMWVLGISINLMSLIGLVVICGIVINDSILKIDAINRLRASGMEQYPAIHEAGHRRLDAIIMTSLTTILAVVPFLRRGSMGDDLQYPMSVVIITGMTVGTFVSLFVVPAIYASIYRRRQ